MPSLLYAGENDTIVIYDRAANGDLERRDRPVPLPRPMRSLCFAPDRYHVYVATNGDPGDTVAPPLLLTFAVDQTTGALVQVGDGVSMPKVPAFVATDRSGRWLLAAAYDSPGHW
jgi:6-phosphogluconolactonase (cycloisomerase 2 family)